MRLPDKNDEQLQEMAQRLCGLTSKIMAHVKPDGELIRLDSTSDLLNNQPATRLFLIKKGCLNSEREGKLIHTAEAGDLIGLARSLQLPEGPYSSNGTVELIPYHRDTLIKNVNSSEELQKNWAFYLICVATFFSESLSKETSMQFKPATGFLYFEKGENIITQGDSPECVYTLLEGTADAIRDGIKVGNINTDEIFGAMAAFTKQPRSANVVATSDCTVLAVNKDEFINLVTHQPKICINLIEEMAEKINSLNKQVIDLQN